MSRRLVGRVCRLAALAAGAVLSHACGDSDLIVAGDGAGGAAYRWTHLNPTLLVAGPESHPVDSMMAEPVGVEVVDENGRPFEGLTVEWRVDPDDGGVAPAASDGVLSALTSRLDAQGRSFAYWRLGTVADTQTLTVSVTGPSEDGTQTTRQTQVRVFARPSRPRSLTIDPSSLTLEQGASADLTVDVRDLHGNAIGSDDVEWSSRNVGLVTVDDRGRVSGVSAGETYVVASLKSAVDSARVEVVASTVPDPDPEPTPGTLELTPGSLELEGVGATAQLSVIARDGTGAVLTQPSLQWSSSNTSVATVSTSGLVTSTGLGWAEIQVTGSCCVGASASVAVVAAPTTQPRTVYVQEGFEDTSFSARGWFANLNLGITSSQRHSGASALEIHFAQGAQNPDHGSASRVQFPETETVYVSYWVKYSTSWVGSGRAYHPHEFQLTTNQDSRWVGPAVTRLTTYIEHNYRQGGLYPRLAMQDAANIDQTRVGVDLTGVTESRAAGGCNGETDGYPTGCYSWGGSYRNEKVWLGSQPALTDATKNGWHHVEAEFRLNSVTNGIGQTDGVARYWIDGQLLVDAQNVLFRTGQHPDMAFWEFLIGVHIGDGSPVDQTMWIDDLVIADRR